MRATEVARRAEHGVAVPLKIYAHCIDGQADAANKRITDALGAKDTGRDPGDEGNGDSRRVGFTDRIGRCPAAAGEAGRLCGRPASAGR